jgi:hypothetical protein
MANFNGNEEGSGCTCSKSEKGLLGFSRCYVQLDYTPNESHVMALLTFIIRKNKVSGVGNFSSIG